MKEVWVRKTGKHYHKDTCLMIDKDYWKVPQWIAKKARYEPCPSCYHPSKIKFKGG